MSRELAKTIRQELKTLGYNSRKVSVRNERGGLSTCIYVVIKCPTVDVEAVEAVGRRHEHVDRCSHTHEILGGGNTFVFVRLSCELREARWEAQQANG